MTLVQILQKLRDDLMQWGTANFEAVNTNFNTVNTNLNAVSAKVSSLQGSSTTNLADLEKRVSTNETNISSNDTDISNLDARVTVNESDISALGEKTEYINATDDKALYIIDANDRVVAYFDAEGLHVTDIEAYNLSLRDGITQNGDTFYIADNAGNVAAYINGEGTHVAELFVKYDATINGNLTANQIEVATGIVQNSEDKFYILDTDDKVALYVDGIGTHVASLYTKNNLEVDGNSTLTGTLNVNGETTLTSLNASEDVNIEGNLTVVKDIEIQGDIQATNIEANQIVKANQIEVTTGIIQDNSDKFFIIDSQTNVAAYIDGTGTHVTNLYAKNNLEVSGNSFLNSILSVNGKTTLNNELYVAKETDTNTLNVRSTSNLAGDLTVQANTDLDGALNVDGHTTMTTLATSGNATVGNNLEVTGIFKSANFDATNSDSFFITDGDMNVVAYFNAGGLYVTDVTTKGIKFNAETNAYEKVLAKTADNYSVNQTLVDLLNNIISIEQRLNNVSNVMDFIGVFNTEVDLYAYENPNEGDVAVVISNQTEYVYSGSDWIEFGYSSYTANALAKLQEVTGHTNGLNIGELDHHTRLENLEAVVGHTNGLNEGELDHHTQLVGLREDLDAEIDDRLNADKAINYRGDFSSESEIVSPEIGDIAVIGNHLKRYTGTSWEIFNGLSKKLYYINGEASDAIYFTDGSPEERVVCYIDATGLHTTDIFAKTYLTVEGGATISGATNLGGNLTVGGSTNLQNTLNVSNESTFNDYVEIKARKNDVTAPGVFPDASHKVPNVSLKTSGTIIAGIATISPQVTTGTLNVLNDANLEKNVNINENLTVNGDTIFYGDVNINGDTGLTVKNTTTIGEAGSTNTNLIVNGNSQFNGDLKVTDVTETNSLNVITVTTTTDLNVSEDANVLGTLHADGNITTNSNVIITGDILAKNFSSEDSDAVYFIDNTGDNVGVYIDGLGLHTYNIEAQTITTRYKDEAKTIKSTTNNMTNVMYFDVEDEVTVSF